MNTLMIPIVQWTENIKPTKLIIKAMMATSISNPISLSIQ